MVERKMGGKKGRGTQDGREEEDWNRRGKEEDEDRWEGKEEKMGIEQKKGKEEDRRTEGKGEYSIR